MARTDNLTNFLTDIAGAIKQRTGDDKLIPASEFDTEILSIKAQGVYQNKEVTLTNNGNYRVTPDENFDALENVVVNVDVEATDTSDATATPDDVINPKTFYSHGQKLIGNIQTTGETVSNTMAANQLTENTSYYIYDIYEKYSLVLLGDAPTSGSTTFYVGVYDSSGQITIVTTKTFEGTITYKKINDMKFSKVDNSNGYVNIFIDTNGGWSGSTYFQIICQFNPATNEIVCTDEFQRSRTGGDQSTVSIVPHPIEDGTYVLCCNRSVNAPDGIMLVKYNAVSHTCYEYSYRAGPSYIGQSRGSGQWNKAGTRFLWLSNCGYLSDTYELYSYTLGGTSLVFEKRNNKTTANNMCWITDNWLLYGSDIIDTAGSVIASVPNLTYNTDGSAFNLNNDGSIVVFRNGSVILLVLDMETYTVISHNDSYSYTNWASGNNKFNNMLLYKPSVFNSNLWYWSDEKLTKVYLDGQYVITSLTVKEKLYVNIADSTGIDTDVLFGKTVYNSSGKITGTMPNNGVLEFSPSDAEQIIPSGYTSGGKVNATDITTLKDYDICLAIADNIIAGGKRYYQLEYMESTGTQYIDTGIIFNKTGYKIVLDLQLTKSLNNIWFCGTGMSFEGGIDKTNFYTGSGFTYSSTNILDRITATGINTKAETVSTYIFARHWTNNYNPAPMKLYSAKIYNNDILVADYIPVKDLAGKVCLYDKIQEKFLYNIGSGEFIGGGVIQ